MTADGDAKRPLPLQFHSIPPLVSSTRIDKENQEQSENLRRSNDETKTKTAASSAVTLTPKHRTVLAREPLSAHPPSTCSSPSPQLLSRIHSQGSKRRVLRYGETLESLFCLTENTPSSHRCLCQDIVEGPLADDPASWRRVVEMASKEVARSGSLSTDRDLIRLYRRATSRFSPFAACGARGKEGDILALWLSYAHAQETFGSTEEARLTFRHIQNQRLGTKNASFYLALSKFEGKYDHERAKQALRSGLEHQAEPWKELKDALRLLELSEKASAATGEVPDVAKKTPAFQSALSTSSARLSLEGGVERKRKTEEDTSPKRRKNNDGTAEVILPSSSSRAAVQESEGNHTTQRTRLQAKRTVRPSSLGSTSPFATSHSATTSGGTQPSKGVSRNSMSTLNVPSEIPSFKSLSKSTTKSSQRRPPLLTKTPRLSRVGLSGKAQRVNPEETLPTDSEDDSTMDTTTKSETIDLKILQNVSDHSDLTTPKPTPKITKVDLTYMLNWDPNNRTQASSSKTSSASKESQPIDAKLQSLPVTSVKSRTPAMEKIEEASASASGSAATSTSVVTSSTHSNGSKSVSSNESHHSDRTCHSQATVTHDNARRNSSLEPAKVEPSVSSEIAALVAKSNVDFLPLVSEDNILHVNNVPYAKLGVIGKGGSCKVYRALSKDCAIYAIKKVKLAGIDKKAISGYANEIALLKRLRGNSSIIKMFDSEVDLSRKAIFMVMELGEVDLNQVMQQQQTVNGSITEGAGGSQRSALDMNFIRLTWQQMLKAVDSIHEERIIHGDLKPANFLFVRGALKLIDFGIAKAIQNDETNNIYRDSHIGTLNYMSPEAIEDTGTSQNGGVRMRIGRASDIWSLGCILYQMVYGRTPFADLKMFQKLQAIANPNHKIHFPDGVEDRGAIDAIKLCLRRKPEERPPIIGTNGLLNEHYFLNSRRRNCEL